MMTTSNICVCTCLSNVNDYLRVARYGMQTGEHDCLKQNFFPLRLFGRDLKQRCHDTNKNTYILFDCAKINMQISVFVT